MLIAADFNRDGKLDLMVMINKIDVYLANGNGTFQPVIHAPGDGVRGAVVADFNGDRNLDVFATAAAGPNSFATIQFGNG